MPLGERDRTGERVRNLKVTPPLVIVVTPDLSDKLKPIIDFVQKTRSKLQTQTVVTTTYKKSGHKWS